MASRGPLFPGRLEIGPRAASGSAPSPWPPSTSGEGASVEAATPPAALGPSVSNPESRIARRTDAAANASRAAASRRGRDADFGDGVRTGTVSIPTVSPADAGAISPCMCISRVVLPRVRINVSRAGVGEQTAIAGFAKRRLSSAPAPDPMACDPSLPVGSGVRTRAHYLQHESAESPPPRPHHQDRDHDADERAPPRSRCGPREPGTGEASLLLQTERDRAGRAVPRFGVAGFDRRGGAGGAAERRRAGEVTVDLHLDLGAARFGAAEDRVGDAGRDSEARRGPAASDQERARRARLAPLPTRRRAPLRLWP